MAEDIDYSNKANERLTCSYQGDDTRIGSNSKYLLEMISNLSCEESLEFKFTHNEKIYTDKLHSLANENMEVTKSFNELNSNSKKLMEMFEQFDKIHHSLNRDVNNLLLDIRHNHRIKANSKSLDRSENLFKLKDLGFIKEDLSGENYELTQLGIVFLNGYNFINKSEAN